MMSFFHRTSREPIVRDSELYDFGPDAEPKADVEDELVEIGDEKTADQWEADLKVTIVAEVLKEIKVMEAAIVAEVLQEIKVVEGPQGPPGEPGPPGKDGKDGESGPFLGGVVLTVMLFFIVIVYHPQFHVFMNDPASFFFQ